MKRSPELRDLSEDHHHGLVLARKAKRAGSREGDLSVSEVWAEAEARFRAELDPHFGIEEAFIGAALERLGETKLAGRLYEEHASLRKFFVPEAGRGPADLSRFGELLEKHIRFEERELFAVAQRVLPPGALDAVANACQARRRGR